MARRSRLRLFILVVFLGAAVLGLSLRVFSARKRQNILLTDFRKLAEAGIREKFPRSFRVREINFLPAENGSDFRLNLSGVAADCGRGSGADDAAPTGREIFLRLEAEQVSLAYSLSDLLNRRVAGQRQFWFYGGRIFCGKENPRPLLSELAGEMRLGNNGCSWTELRGSLAGMKFSSAGSAAPAENGFTLDMILVPENTGVTFLPEGLGGGRLPGRMKLALRGEFQEGDRLILAGTLSASERNFRLQAEAGGEKIKFSLLPAADPAGKEAEFVLAAELDSGGGVAGTLGLNHARIGGVDVLSRVEFRAEYASAGNDDWNLRVETAAFNTVLNYQPFWDLQARCLLRPGNFEISSLELGREYRLSGWLDWKEAPKMEARLDINDADTGDLMLIAGSSGRLAASGRFRGTLRVAGLLAGPKIDFHLSGEKGNIGKLDYEWSRINFSGIWPALRAVDSVFKHEDGLYSLEGEMDLRRLGTPDVLAQLSLIGSSKTVVWQGWDIARPESEAKLEVGKNVGEEFRVAFRALLPDETLRLPEEKEEMEIAYRLGGNRTLGLKLKKEEEILGVEHKIEF